MISFARVTRQVGARRLLDDVSIEISDDERIGIVGPNGAGKTTLLRLVLGLDRADEGTVNLSRGTSVGYLPQEALPSSDRTPLDLALEPGEHLAAVLLGIERVEAEIEHASHRHGPEAEELQHRLADEFGTLHDQLRHHGGHQREARARRALAGLGFEPGDEIRPLSTFSGGWIMRAALARLLADPPDILVLDEPTNHLDLDAVLWLQAHLARFDGCVLVVSHDRSFLDTVVTQIVEVDRGKLVRYRGGYSDYRRQREERLIQLTAAAGAQTRRRRETEKFIERFRAKASKASQVQSRIKALGREDRIEVERAGPTLGFRFPQPKRTARVTLELDGIEKSWDGRPLYENFHLVVERGEKIALVGPNGAGKSTLLGLLAGTILPDAGDRRVGMGVRTALYTQHRAEMLDLGSTVIQNANQVGASIGETALRTLLGAFLFRGDDVQKPVSVLSGGEKSRLALALLLLDPPSVFLMDEPTIHLDVDSVDALVNALKIYEGTLCFVSHDLHFVRTLASRVIRVDHAGVEDHRGDWESYEWAQRKRAEEAAETPAARPSTAKATARPAARPSTAKAAPQPITRFLTTKATLASAARPSTARTAPAGATPPTVKQPAPDLSKSARREGKRLEAERRNELSRRTRDLRRDLEQTEREVKRLETEQAALEAQLADPAAHASTSPAELGTSHAWTNRDLKTAVDRWTELMESIEKITAEMGADPG